jgi:hypothetical protein
MSQTLVVLIRQRTDTFTQRNNDKTWSYVYTHAINGVLTHDPRALAILAQRALEHAVPVI